MKTTKALWLVGFASLALGGCAQEPCSFDLGHSYEGPGSSGRTGCESSLSCGFSTAFSVVLEPDGSGLFFRYVRDGDAPALVEVFERDASGVQTLVEQRTYESAFGTTMETDSFTVSFAGETYTFEVRGCGAI